MADVGRDHVDGLGLRGGSIPWSRSAPLVEPVEVFGEGELEVRSFAI
jgi:hypothetical protein